MEHATPRSALRPASRALHSALSHISRPHVLIILLILAYVPFLGLRNFTSHGEPREALLVEDIVSNGHWILASRYGEDLATKPPLFHWLGGVCSSVFSTVSEFTVRLPSAALSLLVLLLLFRLIREERDKREAWVTILVLATLGEWFRHSILARVDMTLAAFMSVGCIYLYRWERRSLVGIPWMASFFLSLAFLTKGPVGLALPCMMFTLYLFARSHSFSAIVRALFLCVLPSLPLPVLWYALALQSGGDAFASIVWQENFGRFLGTMDPGEDPHSHGILYLVAALLAGTLPWSILLLACIPLRLRQLKLPQNLQSLWSIEKKDPLLMFSMIILVSTFAFYSLPESKRGVYLLSSYPFVAILLARLFIYLESTGHQRLLKPLTRFFRFFRTTGFVAGVLCTLIVVSAYLHSVAPIFLNSSVSAISESILSGHPLIALCLSLAGILLLIWMPNECSFLEEAVAPLVITLIIVVAAALPLMSPLLSGKDFANTLDREFPNLPVFSLEDRLYELDFYLHRDITLLPDAHGVQTPTLVVLREKRQALLGERYAQCSTVPLATSKLYYRRFGSRLLAVSLNCQKDSNP